MSIHLKIFTNASKAITSGQEDLLRMFIKKHPGVCRVRHEVKRDPRVRVNKETGERVVEEATACNMTLLEIAAETGKEAEGMCEALMEGMGKGKELMDSLSVMYEGEKCGLGVMARVGMRKCMEMAVGRVTEDGVVGAMGKEECMESMKGLKVRNAS